VDILETVGEHCAELVGGALDVSSGVFEQATPPGPVVGMMFASSQSSNETGPYMADVGDDPRKTGGQPNPRAKLMQEVAEEMDAIETEFGDAYQIGRVILVAEVLRPNDEVGLRVRAGQYPWVTLGMLEAAKKSIEIQMFGGSGQ
jgi:hypothetical protein